MIKGLFYYDGGFDSLSSVSVEELSIEAEKAYRRRLNFADYLECYIIESTQGESEAFCAATDLSDEASDLLVLINSTFLLNFDRFTWDDEKQEFKVWFWDEHLQEFRHINDLTQKDLRKAHNIIKIYNNGGLDIHPAWHKEK